MEFENFSEEVLKGVKNRLQELGNGQEIKLVPVEKSNNRHLSGIVFEQPKSNVTPCIYMEELFARYENGTDISEIIEKVSLFMAEQSEPSVDVKRFTDPETVMSHLTFRLADYEKNEEWLSDKVYERFGDFAKVAFISVSDDKGGTASTVFKKEFLDSIGITENEVLEAAQNGLDKQEIVFMSLNQMMQEMMGSDTPQLEDERTIYVLTNEDRTLGAAVITREGVLQDISEKIGGSYYVLPSSIHELLIAPMNIAFTREELSNMVREVNASEVSAEDFLSDKVQIYSASRDKLMNAEKYEELQKAKVSAR